MPRCVRSVVTVTALLAAACGAFSGEDEDEAPAPPSPSVPDAALVEASTPGDGAPVGGDDAGPPACGIRSCTAGTECAYLDFAGGIPDEWTKHPADNPPFALAEGVLRATGKQGRVSYLENTVESAGIAKLVVELDVRVNDMVNDETPLGLAAWTSPMDEGDSALLALKPNGKVTVCAGSAATNGCSGDLGSWTKKTWHHVRWVIEGPLNGSNGVKGSVAVDCGAPAAFSGGAVALAGAGGSLAFRVGVPASPTGGDYSVDVDNVVRIVDRAK